MSELLSEQKLRVKLEGNDHQSLVDLSKKIDTNIIFDETFDQCQDKCKQIADDTSFRVAIDPFNQSQDASSFAGLQNEFESVKRSKTSKLNKKAITKETTHQLDQDVDNSQNIKNTAQSQSSKQNRRIVVSGKRLSAKSKIQFTKTQQNTQNYSFVSVRGSTKYKFSGLNTIDKIIRIITVIKPQLLKYFENYTMSGRYRFFNANCRLLLNDKVDFTEQNNEKKVKCIKKAEFEDLMHIFNYIAIGAWVSEMLIQMNTSTYYEGEFITDRKIIFKIYIKDYFFFEILPLIFEGKTSQNQALNIIYKLPLLLKLKGMSIILLLTHLMACSYVALAQFETNILGIQTTWLNKSQIMVEEYKWWSAYIEAQFWAFHTMGNSYSISVYTQQEYAFTSFWMLISCVLYAYLVNALGTILSNINSNSENYKKDLNILNRYMQRKKIDLELQRIMNIHLQNQYEQQSQVQFELEKETLNKLSHHMRNKLFTESNKNIIQQFHFLKQFSQQTLTSVYQIMQEESYTEGLIIPTFDDTTLDSYVYLIVKGSVDIIQLFQYNEEESDFIQEYQTDEKKKSHDYQEKGQKVIKRLTAGQSFGEYDFFVNTQLPYKVQSSKQTIVIKISQRQFIEIINNNKQDYQKFMEIRHKVRLNNEMNQIYNCCIICNARNHNFIDCYQTHFPKHPQFIIFKHSYFPLQQRDQNHQRKQGKHSRCLMINQNQNKQSIPYLDDDQESFHEYYKDDESSKQKQFKSQAPSINLNKKDSYGISALNVQEQLNSEQSQKELEPQKLNVNETSNVKNNSIGNNLTQLAPIIVNNNSNSNIQSSNINTHNKRSSARTSIVIRRLSNNVNIEIKDQNDNQVIQYDDREKQYKQNSFNNIDQNYQGVYHAFNKQLSSKVITPQTFSTHRQSATNNFPQNFDNKSLGNDHDNLHFQQELHYKTNELNAINNKNNNLQVFQKNSFQQQVSFQNGSQRFFFDNAFYKAQWDTTILYWMFDQKCEFLYFFPRSNSKHVLKSFEKRQNLIKEKKKKKLKKAGTSYYNIK
ncbi:cyclic nucleotide-binding domain protein (macronuclear) [Tetrahymena thermophila SB210]|uniref:Cyclic nucleotide-binding domain protein n=1 Tax=Tetrahymena thermophila (strain SB210) TaxID=312017 RepID=I7MAG6_TETTS|nr:cyclic nucleotide-binding domain protein [Tetrahymena thermophila SB210]EAS04554.2 cyclic nucleotide-binding domain protein [Tetrahymena thermophila SB210]|eukprot:XP_001024799.2 cyclic nucleotide-binding domain protein [Tetrahymena thermophila SB210]